MFKFLPAFILCASSICLAQTCSIPNLADNSVNNIFLHDTESQEIVIGKNSKFTDGSNSSLSLTFASSKGDEYLKLLTHEGGIGGVAEFEISYLTKSKLKIPKLKRINKFISGKGIQLGMSKANLLSILGKPSKELNTSESVTLIYRIEDLEGKNEFLNCYNMPIYFGNYLFKNNKLFKFQFGFEYP